MKSEQKLSWQEMMAQPASPPETPRMTDKTEKVTQKYKPLWCVFLCAGNAPDETQPNDLKVEKGVILK